MDRYTDFKTLAANETENVDFRIRLQYLNSPVSVIAPHGSRIEPNTARIARQIAGNQYNCYCFEGLKPSNNKVLHITSHRFDEPKAIDLISASDIVVTIHACRDKQDIVYIGGLFRDLGREIKMQLTDAHIPAAEHKTYKGVHPDNICNRSRIKKGVQLEISRSIRDNPDKSAVVAKAVRRALDGFSTTPASEKGRLS